MHHHRNHKSYGTKPYLDPWHCTVHSGARTPSFTLFHLHWQLACTESCNMYYETSYELAPDLFCRPATKCTLFSHSPAEYMHNLVST